MDLIDNLERANQLARAIVANIKILHEPEITKALEKDSFYEELASVLEEGRALFCARVSQDVQESTTFDCAVHDIMIASSMSK